MARASGDFGFRRQVEEENLFDVEKSGRPERLSGWRREEARSIWLAIPPRKSAGSLTELGAAPAGNR
jgi:hypothetical protein